MSFKNLPIITTKIVDAGTPAAQIFSRPIALGLGWIDDDYFGTTREPIFFNTPYYIADESELGTLLPNGGEAVEIASMLAAGANKADPNASVVPVVVRIGYPDYKVSNGTTEVTDANGSISDENSVVTVTWEAQNWDTNVKVAVVKNGDDSASVYYNYDSENQVGYEVATNVTVDATEGATIELEWLNATLTIDGTAWASADAGVVAEFEFTARKKPTSNEERYKALIDALKEIEGLEVAFVGAANVHLDDIITADTTSVWIDDPDYAEDLTQVKLNFGYALARFAYKVSNSYHSCFAVIGVKKPTAVGPSNLKNWVSSLNNLEGWKDGFYATSSGKLGDAPLVDENGSQIDIGKHLIVTAFHGTISGYNTNDLGPYIGAWLANRPTGVAGTFMNIEFTLENLGISAVEDYILMLHNYNVIDDIYGARINIPVPVYDTTGTIAGFRIPIARTGAMPSSSFTKLSTTKIAIDLMQDLRDTAQAFLGRPLSGMIMEVMRSELQKVVDGYKRAGYFAAGSVAVEAGEIGTVLGEVKVTVTVQMYAEITTVTITGIFSIAGV